MDVQTQNTKHSRKKLPSVTFYEIKRDESNISCYGWSELEMKFGSSKEKNIASEEYGGGIYN
jgi:hypothetical protein